MKKSAYRKVIILFFIVIAQFLIAYIGLAFYYRNAFEYGTWINGVYCTGKSIEEVNKDLSDKFEYEGITIYDRDQNAYQITAGEIDYQYDFTGALELYLDMQNSWLWVDCLWKVRNDELKPATIYDDQAFEECFNNMSFISQGEKEDGRFEIVKTDNGYELVDERRGLLDIDAAKRLVEAAVKDAESCINLEEEGCYYDMELTDEMQAVLNEWELVKAFQDCHIVYQIGDDKIPVDASVVCDWILLEEDGSFALDKKGKLQLRENAVEEFIDKLADEYDTVGKTRYFMSTRGDVVEVEGGIYGNQLDKETEAAYLTEAFIKKADEVHTPAYSQTAKQQGEDDIGNTYLEIDMTQQMMYYYLNGKLEVETPIVTGNTSRRMGTPSGVNYVYLKQTDRILRGEGYASHVNFWMPVKGNIGIHDAAWRSTYGGQIYQTNGSHGCINTPYDAMTKIYDMVEVGTPVVMFY
ncbi:MAG: L,D-transpeptidase family protein [Lachnospiraceae bacterium]|nr:L,D-transpeptidase family protein [Lachnospiraceae bacterium]